MIIIIIVIIIIIIVIIIIIIIIDFFKYQANRDSGKKWNRGFGVKVISITIENNNKTK